MFYSKGAPQRGGLFIYTVTPIIFTFAPKLNTWIS